MAESRGSGEIGGRGAGDKMIERRLLLLCLDPVCLDLRESGKMFGKYSGCFGEKRSLGDYEAKSTGT